MNRRENGIIKPNIKDSTLERVEENIGRPITHGFDKALNQCLDELDELKAKQANQANKLDCLCPETKEAAAQNG